MTNIARLQIEADSRQVRTAARDLNNLGRSGNRSGRDMNRFSDQTRRATQSTQGLSNAARTLTRVLGAVGIGLSVRALQQFVNSTTAAANEIGKLSNVTGISTDRLQELGFAFGQLADITDQQVNESLIRFTRRLDLARRGTGAGQKAFEAMGISLNQTTDSALRQTIQTLTEMGETQSIVGLASEVFGDRTGPLLASALQQGTSAMTEQIAEARRLGLVIDEDLIRNGERMADEFRILSTQLRTQFQAVVLDNADALIGLSNALRDMIQFISENIRLFQALGVALTTLVGIKLGAWALSAATGLRGLAAAAALLTGPGAAIIALGAVIGAIANDMEKAKNRTDEFANSLRGLTMTQLQNHLAELKSELASTVAAYDQLNIHAGPSPETLRKQRALREEIAGVNQVMDELEASAVQAGESTTNLGNDAEEATQDFAKLGQAFAASIPAMDLLPPRLRDLRQGVEQVGTVTGKASDGMDDLADSGTKAAQDVAEEYSQLATQIEGAFAGAFERIFATGKIGFSELADEVGSIFRSNIAQQLAGALPGIGQSLGIAGGQAIGSASSNVTSMLQTGARVQIPVGAQLTAGAAQSFALSSAGQAAGLSLGPVQGTGGSGAAAAPSLTPQGQEFVAQGGQTGAAIGAGVGMIGGTLVGGGGPAASSMASTGAMLGFALTGGPVGAVVGGILGGIFGGGSDRRRLDAEQKQRIENMIAELEVTIENNRALTEAERETMKAKRRLEELNMARNEENRELIETKQQLEDRLEILEQINRVNDERNNLERRYLTAIGDTTALREMEIQATEAANRGLLRFVFQVEDQVRAVAQAEGAARNAFQILQEAVRAEREQLDQMLGRPLQMVSQALDRLTSTSREAITLADRQAAMRTLEQARQLGVGSLPEEDLERALEVVSQPSEGLFTSFVDYQRDFGRARSLLQEIEEVTGQQFRSETERLDAIIADGEKQLNALFGIETAVMTVEQAINNLSGSISAAESARSALSNLTANRPSFAPATEPAPAPAPAPSLDVGALQAAGSLAASRGPGTAMELSLQSHERRILSAGGLSVNDLNVFRINSALEGLRDRIRSAGGVPEFADGGMHTGGMRIVGERGPELEMTGASRIISNADTRDLLGSDDMIAELRELRSEVASLRSEQARSQYQLVKNSKRTKDTLEKFDIDGLPPERT